MLHKMDTSAKLYLLVFVMSVFIVGIGVYGIHESSSMNRNTRTLYADRLLPMEQLATVRYAYLVNIISAAEQVQTHHLSWQEAEKRVAQAVESITPAWTAYMHTYLTPPETEAAGQAAALIKQSAVMIKKLKTVLQQQNAPALDNFINTALYPAVNPIVLKLDVLFNLQVQIGKTIYNNSAELYNASFKRSILLIILSLLFAIPFSWYLVKSNEEKYRNIFENVRDVFFQTNLAGSILDVSPSVKNLTGLSRDELIGRQVDSIYYNPADREKGLRLIKEKGEVKDLELFLKTSTGEPLHAAVSAHLIPGAKGRPTHIDGILRDITDRKKTEEKLQQSEANYRQLFTLSPVPMWVFDEVTGRFIQVNEACTSHYGYSQQEFAELTIRDIIPKDTGNKDEGFFMGGHRHVKKSGEYIDVETSSLPVIVNGKRQVLVVAIDVTERNRYEEQLTRAAIKAQEDERYEIGGELHDNVCQVLATAMIFLTMMKEELSPGSQQVFNQTRAYIRLATDEIRNLSHRLAPAFFDGASLSDAFENLLAAFNAEKKYAIKMDFNETARQYPLSRELQLNLYRIVQEQLRNIVKHANATAITVTVGVQRNMLQLRIADNGAGFDTGAGKAGIGLANMNRRAKLFSGNFFVNAAVGKGCDVLVEVPLPAMG